MKKNPPALVVVSPRFSIVFDIVTSDHEFVGFAGAVEDFGLLFGKQAGGKRVLCQPFFLDKP
jgi:hypothetical protein